MTTATADSGMTFPLESVVDVTTSSAPWLSNDTVPLSLSEVMCPTAIGSGAWQMYVAAALYAMCGLFAVYELFRSLCAHSQTLWSFRSAFFGLCALTMLGRGFLITVPLGPWLAFNLMFFVLMLPIYLQCLTFSLLIVFLARAVLVLRGRSEYVRKYLYPIYTSVVVAFFAINILFAWLAATKWRIDLKRSDFDQNMSIFWFIEFATILLTGAYSAYETFRILHGSLLDQTKRRRVKLLFALSITFFVLYLFRTIYDILYYFGHNPLQSAIGIWVESDSAVDRQYFFTAFLLFYTITEILPAFVVIVVIRKALPSRTNTNRSVNNRAHDGNTERQPINRFLNSSTVGYSTLKD